MLFAGGRRTNHGLSRSLHAYERLLAGQEEPAGIYKQEKKKKQHSEAHLTSRLLERPRHHHHHRLLLDGEGEERRRRGGFRSRQDLLLPRGGGEEELKRRGRRLAPSLSLSSPPEPEYSRSGIPLPLGRAVIVSAHRLFSPVWAFLMGRNRPMHVQAKL